MPLLVHLFGNSSTSVLSSRRFKEKNSGVVQRLLNFFDFGCCSFCSPASVPSQWLVILIRSFSLASVRRLAASWGTLCVTLAVLASTLMALAVAWGTSRFDSRQASLSFWQEWQWLTSFTKMRPRRLIMAKSHLNRWVRPLIDSIGSKLGRKLFSSRWETRPSFQKNTSSSFRGSPILNCFDQIYTSANDFVL